MTIEVDIPIKNGDVPLFFFMFTMNVEDVPRNGTHDQWGFNKPIIQRGR